MQPQTNATPRKRTQERYQFTIALNKEDFDRQNRIVDEGIRKIAIYRAGLSYYEELIKEEKQLKEEV